MNQPVITSDFDCLIPFIRVLDRSRNYIQFELPISFLIDIEKVVAILEDAEVEYTSGSVVIIKILRGTVKSDELFEYMCRLFDNYPFQIKFPEGKGEDLLRGLKTFKKDNTGN